MKIIFSYVDLGSTRYLDHNMIKISNNLVKKHGYKTALYVDKKNLEKFKDINYDEIIIFNQDDLDSLPKNIWSLGKLLAFGQINEPFCHIDFDLFMLNDILKSFKDKGLFCFHSEPWIIGNHFSFFSKIVNEIGVISGEDNLISYNCALFGGTKFNEINEAAKIILNYAKNNNYMLNSLQDNNLFEWQLPVLFEQVFFVNICKKILNIQEIPLLLTVTKGKKINWDSIYKEMFKKRVLHLGGIKEIVMQNI